jgi:hypothetical protein
LFNYVILPRIYNEKLIEEVNEFNENPCAEEIADILDAKLIVEADTSTYDFVIDTEMARGLAPLGETSILQEALSLSTAIQNGVVK